jgi:hypothetical protein
MRQTVWTRTLLLVAGWLGGSTAGLNGGDTIRAQDLSGLSQAGRVAVMKAVLERRIDRVRNIEVASEMRGSIRQFANGRLGDKVRESGWYEFRLSATLADYS